MGAVFPKRPTCLIAYTMRMSTYEMQVPYKLGTSRRILRTSKIESSADTSTEGAEILGSSKNIVLDAMPIKTIYTIILAFWP